MIRQTVNPITENFCQKYPATPGPFHKYEFNGHNAPHGDSKTMFDHPFLAGVHPLTQTLLLAVLLVFCNSGTAVEIGDLAPGFELHSIDGELLSLIDYRGKKAVYLVFWNSWCSYCIENAPRYTKLKEKFGDRVEIIAINTTWSDSLEEIEQYQQRFGVNYPIALDNGEVLTRRYAVSAVPTEFIIDINGVIRYRDGVPEYIATHIPDWFQAYTADMNPTQVCLR